MSFLGKLLGGGMVSAAGGVANIIDQFVETPDEKVAAEKFKLKLMQQPQLAQIELNKIEAGHRTIFVAGWRPFIGWVCGSALAWHFLVYDVLCWAQHAFAPTLPAPPALAGTETLVTVVMSLLGLGALRTVEKVNGRAK